MRRGWRLLRHRGLRSRSGQVSAVATILALLLFVSFLATFVFGQLPAQMSQQEFEHQLQVEDQMEGLQTAIAEAAAAWQPGSGIPGPSVLWNQGNLCTPTVVGTTYTCTNGATGLCNPGVILNQSKNMSTLVYMLGGSSDCITINILGSNDTIDVELGGSNDPSFVLTLFGTNDTIVLPSTFGGSSDKASFYLFGADDNYTTATGPGGSHLVLNTYFIGESPSSAACPYQNLSKTDRYSFVAPTGSGNLQNLTWYNNVGYSTTYHTTPGYPGNLDTSGATTGWQNVSAPISCAFPKAITPGPPISAYLTSPLTLSSGGSPPFGIPSSGSLQSEPPRVETQATFGISNVSAAPIAWNTGTACFAATSPGSGTCTKGVGLEYYNFQGNSTTVSPTVAGCATAGGCQVEYNVSGNHNTLTLTLSGANISAVLFQVSGNSNSLTVKDGGTCNIAQHVSVVFSGTNDTYALTMSGCSTGAGAYLTTLFVGSSGNVCPYGDVATTDTFTTPTWGSSTGIYQNFTWRNANGLASSPNTISRNGGTDYLTFANTSGYYPCLFTASATTGPYTLNFLSGIQAVLNNRYISPAIVAYDQGAVILGVQNGGSVMVSPPSSTYVVDPTGVDFKLALVNLIGNPGTATGYGTASVISYVQSVVTYQINDGKQGSNYLPYFFLNITTEFPQAWSTYWASQHAVDPTGNTCVPGNGVTTATCLTPPLGRTSTIVVPIDANQLTFVSILAQVSIY
jgi:hypothetical protein